MIHRNNVDLLQAISKFRDGDACPGSVEWDTLMHFFEDACREYAIEKLYNKWFSDDEAVDMLDTEIGDQLYIDYLEIYLVN